MRMKLPTLICVIAFALGGCNGTSKQDNPPPTVSDAISGVVATGVPVTGVPVTMTDATGKTSSSSPTDAMGNYHVSTQGLQSPFVLTASFTEIDGSAGTLSSVINTSGSAHANLNPITSLITQRVLATVLSGAPSAAQVKNQVTDNRILQATQDVIGALGPLLNALHVSSAALHDPIGSSFTADPSIDAMDALFEVARIHVSGGTVSVGFDADKVVVHIPATGAVDIPDILTAKSLASVQSLASGPTSTPITHVIVVVGENQSFDALFGGYQPPAGQSVMNLLSQGIIKADGTPGPNFSRAAQNQALATSTFTIELTRSAAYDSLPQPRITGILDLAGLQYDPSNPDPFSKTLWALFYNILQANNLANFPDPRFPSTLANGPFQISKYVPYTSPTSATGDPVHRFFQMWQQTGGDNSHLDMYTWVAVNTGQGGETTGITQLDPGQGGELMGFVNMSAGDAPFFNATARQYAMSDNYHQGIMGGTGMNFFSLATGDLPYFNVGGSAAVPPANQIENPNPVAGTSNFYTHDGYQGGSYVNCSDATQAGVQAILAKLAAWGHKSNCDAGKYYLVNNYNPPFDMNGNAQLIAPTNFTYPAQTVPTIAEALAAKGVSWAWYTGGREPADVADDAATYAVPIIVAQTAQYNSIGDPLTASTKVMSTPSLSVQLKGLTSFYNAVAAGNLPSVSFVVPKNLSSGHPGNSAPAALETFLTDLVSKVQANPTLWAHTAIILTTDEGGGYFDSGYIQNIDFFGDGPRIPMQVVSPYARTGYIDHIYHDHTSVLKFIERNWRLKPLSQRSRDNLPNPVGTMNDPYRPVNGPAIGDLMTMFAF